MGVMSSDKYRSKEVIGILLYFNHELIDSVEAEQWWFEKCKQLSDANKNNLDLLFELGMCHYWYTCTPKGLSDEELQKHYREKTKKAIELFRLAAEQGHANSQNALGVLIDHDANAEEKRKWFHLAMEQGHDWAMINLAETYVFDEENYAEAAKWYYKASLIEETKEEALQGLNRLRNRYPNHMELEVFQKLEETNKHEKERVLNELKRKINEYNG